VTATIQVPCDWSSLTVIVLPAGLMSTIVARTRRKVAGGISLPSLPRMDPGSRIGPLGPLTPEAHPARQAVTNAIMATRSDALGVRSPAIARPPSVRR
jgi:hypothetical protein